MDLKRCPVRYVLDNALTALCTDLAYSKGTTVLSCVDSQARFYLDAADEGATPAFDPAILRVHSHDMDPAGVLSRCFHFEFEEIWARYYQQVPPDPSDQQAILHQSMGRVAHAIPVLLAFFLLLSARAGLPQRETQLARLNRARVRRGRAQLEDHIEVCAPLLPEYRPAPFEASIGTRRTRRLHHAR